MARPDGFPPTSPITEVAIPGDVMHGTVKGNPTRAGLTENLQVVAFATTAPRAIRPPSGGSVALDTKNLERPGVGPPVLPAADTATPMAPSAKIPIPPSANL